MCHVIMLKQCHARGGGSGSSRQTVALPVASVLRVSSVEEDHLVMRGSCPQGATLSNSEVLSNLTLYLSHLSHEHRCDIERLLSDFPELFSDIPSQTHVIAHDVP